MGDILKLVLLPLLVTIIGSIIFSLLSRIKKEFKITCEQLSLRQYKEKESDDVKITLSYKNEKVGDSLSVMTVRLANNGKKDITFNQVFEDKIQIKLKNAEILDVQIEKQSDKVAAFVEKSDSLGWLLSWSILKKKETIDLKVVSVFNKAFGEGNVEASDLEFVFRGNNLNRIEPIGSQMERVTTWTFVVVSIFLLALVALMPLRNAVQYDVVFQGKYMKDATLSYNMYNDMYIIKQSGEPIIKTKEIPCLVVSKQSICSSDFFILGVSLLVYMIFVFVFLKYIKRHKKNPFWSFFFNQYTRE